MTDKPQESGGPAFPVSIPGCGDNGWHGMTLRDWFAGQAISGAMSVAVDASDLDKCAIQAYALADAMLKARQSLP